VKIAMWEHGRSFSAGTNFEAALRRFLAETTHLDRSRTGIFARTGRQDVSAVFEQRQRPVPRRLPATSIRFLARPGSAAA
jgi:hypothetical protein